MRSLMMRSYINNTDSFERLEEALQFIAKMYESMAVGMVIDYVQIERPYDDPTKYHVEFSARTPHPDYDILPTEDPIGDVFYPNKETK
jgi:hypothetical protein